MQPTAELALALVCCRIHCPERLGRRDEPILEVLASLSDRPEVTDRLLRSPQALTLFTYLYVALRGAARHRPEDGEVLQTLLDSGYLEQNEHVPFRMMDLRLALEWAGCEPDLPSWNELVEASILAQRIRVPCGDVSSAYALTHALFFAVAFGTRAAPASLARRLPRLASTLSAFLVSFTLERDWDLVAELLLCWECLGLEESSVTRQAWAALLEQQGVDGAFPGPEGRSPRRSSAEDDDPRAARFDRRYHTTLATLMALACRARRRPAGLGRRTTRRALSTRPRAERLVPIAERTGRWLDKLMEELVASESPRPKALCQALVASWLCDEIAGAESGRVPALTRRIACHPRANDTTSACWSSVPAGLKLVSAALLRARGANVTALESFLEQATTILRAAPVRSAEDELDLYEKRVLLHALGLLKGPPPLLLNEVERFVQTMSFSDLTAPEDLLVRIDACTAFGLRTIGPVPPSPDLVDLVAGFAAHFLRVYELPRACRAVRTLSRLGSCAHVALDESCEFLLAQATPAGSFGRFGPELADLEQSDAPLEPEYDLLLPVALDCLWALAEGMCDGWRLYSALPGTTGRWVDE
jgi:hypothetical protein